MVKDKAAILQEIVDHYGDCNEFATPAICKRCPLGNKRINGRKVNCMDFLKITEEMHDDEVCDIYQRAAEDELFGLELEEHLLED